MARDFTPPSARAARRRTRGLMGARLSALGLRKAGEEASKRRLPKYDGGGGGGGGAAPTTSSAATTAAATRERPESYLGAETFDPASTTLGGGPDETLDSMLSQLSGSVKTRSVPIPLDREAVAQAQKLRTEVRREANANRITVADLERALRDPAVAIDKGVPKDVVDDLLASLRMPRKDDYVDPNEAAAGKGA